MLGGLVTLADSVSSGLGIYMAVELERENLGSCGVNCCDPVARAVIAKAAGSLPVSFMM